MDKKIIFGASIIITLFFIGAYLFLIQDEESSINSDLKENASDPALGLKDFPDGWKIKSRGGKSKSDVSKEGIKLGWLEGYIINKGYNARSQEEEFRG